MSPSLLNDWIHMRILIGISSRQIFSSWLQSAKKISKEEYTGYFWEGIHKGLYAKIEGRLLANDPNKDLSIAFVVDKVISMAEKLLHWDHFDADLLISEDETDSSASESEDTSSAESDSTTSSSEDSETEEEVKAHKSKKKSQKKHSSSKDTPKHKESHSGISTPKDTSRKTKGSKDTTTLEPQDEIESLIKQLNSMSLDDPQYALLYYRVTQLDPRVMKIVSPPPQRNIQEHLLIHQSPEMLGDIIIVNLIIIKHHQEQDIIYLQVAHLRIESVLAVKRRDIWFPIVQSLGNCKQRAKFENLIEDRFSIMMGHLLDIYLKNNEDLNAYMIPGLSDDTEDEDYYVYPVERNIKTSTKARQEHFDGVFPPPLKHTCNEDSGPKGKENVSENKPYTAPRSKASLEPQKNTESREKPKPLSKSGQGNANMKTHIKPRFNEDDDIIMEDGTKPSEPSKIKDKKKEPKNDDEKTIKENTVIPPKPIHKCISDLAACAKPEKVLESVLRTPVLLEVGEILGASCKLSGILANAIKPKPLVSDQKN
ncbi:hypothetical protein BDR05DRAFT_953707 [Suillus weaverae]|nr:hypothetical protein BDR05DRAFT_953707 [Suillus weaverae]